jgi:KipI family sensor histidine kinase inhibitor
MSRFSFSIVPFGEFGLLATISGGDMLAKALAANFVADAIRSTEGVLDCVAGVDGIAIRFHPIKMSLSQTEALLEESLNNIPDQPTETHKTVEIPVCYGGECGPDFQLLCEKLALSSKQFIDLHSSHSYRVLTIGFAPGFAYLGPLPDDLQTERLASPRSRVPAGSVGIAGAMTGIYPLASPGGWPLIGRTPSKLFDAAALQPFLFAPGATVRFTPIDESEFAKRNCNKP